MWAVLGTAIVSPCAAGRVNAACIPLPSITNKPARTETQGEVKPEVSVALSDSAMGTSVKLKYDFYQVVPSAGFYPSRLPCRGHVA